MTPAHHPHLFLPRWGSFIALAFVAVMAVSLLVVNWPVAIPGGAADPAAARGTNDSTSWPTDIGQQFYREKAVAPAHELPAQF